MNLTEAIQHFLPHDTKGREIDEYCLTLTLYERDECYLAPEGLVIGDDIGNLIVAFFDGTGVYCVDGQLVKSNSAIRASENYLNL